MDSPLLHVANILYLASYSVRDILWLRALTVLAMLCLSWCYWECAAYNALWWQAAFLTINIAQICVLVHERRPVQLTPDQKRLHAGPLKTLTPRQVQKFAGEAEWKAIEAEQRLLSENSDLDYLILILSGKARIVAKGEEIATIDEGQFAGEMSFLTGDKTSADVIAEGPVLYARWPEEYVTELIRKDQDLGTALQAALGMDLVKKLLRTRDKRVSQP